MKCTPTNVERVVLGLLFLFAVSSISADDEWFALWNECQPVGVNTWISEDAEQIGLSEERLISTVESRLRVARIYDDSDFSSSLYPYLGVNVHVVPIENRAHIFSIEIGLYSLVHKAPTDSEGWAETWSEGLVSGYAGHLVDGGSYVLQWVRESVDKFIASYLRVNSDAC